MPPKIQSPIGLKEFLAMPENEKRRLEAMAKNQAVRESKKMEVKPEVSSMAKPKEAFTFTNSNTALKESGDEVFGILKALLKPYGIAKIRNSGVEFTDKKNIIFQDYKLTEEDYFNSFMPQMMKQYPKVNDKIRKYLSSTDYKKPILATGIINRKTNQLYLQLLFPDSDGNPSQISNNAGWPQEIVVLSNVEKYPTGSKRKTPLITFLENKITFKNRDEILKFIFQ